MKPRSVIVCIRYAVEISPTVKNLAQILHEEGHEVIVLMDHFYRGVPFQPPYARVIGLYESLHPYIHRLFHYFPSLRTKFKNGLIGRRLKQEIKGHDYLFIVEGPSLAALKDMNVKFNRAAYLFMENTQMLHEAAKSDADVYKRLSACAVHVIQSKERGDNVNRELGTSYSFSYLPVSQRPTVPPTSPTSTGTLSMIFSGYFAPWSMVLELVEQAARWSKGLPVQLKLQGHLFGDSTYLQEVEDAIRANELESLIHVDTGYVSDDNYLPMLSSHHVGIAFYGAGENNNWENLIFSSGKIASYLWAGLPVITNLKDPLTKDFPFVDIEHHTTDEVILRLRQILEDPAKHRAKALEFAQRYYNFDEHADRLLRRMNIRKGGAA
jgi:hypothetical protein